MEVRTSQGTAKGVAHSRWHSREKTSQDSPRCVSRSGEAGRALCRAAGGCPCGARQPLGLLPVAVTMEQGGCIAEAKIA